MICDRQYLGRIRHPPDRTLGAAAGTFDYSDRLGDSGLLRAVWATAGIDLAMHSMQLSVLDTCRGSVW